MKLDDGYQLGRRVSLSYPPRDVFHPMSRAKINQWAMIADSLGGFKFCMYIVYNNAGYSVDFDAKAYKL